VNVGGSGTEGTSVSNTTYFADQPRISLGPNGSGLMSKKFSISGVGIVSTSQTYTNISKDRARLKFSVCLSYSIDGGKSFKKIVTDFFVNSQVFVPVERHGAVNDALRRVYMQKPDAVNEPCWILNFDSNVPGDDSYQYGVLCDYQ